MSRFIFVIVIVSTSTIILLDMVFFNNVKKERNDSTPINLPGSILSINQTLIQIRNDLKRSTDFTKPATTKQKDINNITIISPNSIPITVQNTIYKRKKKFVLFTMDSISSYEANSRAGGAAGELIIRKSLENVINLLGSSIRIVRSDDEFANLNLPEYDVIILDSWTWAAKGWVPKPHVREIAEKLFILDFFGSQQLRGSSFLIDPHRILTAYGSKWNTFLGYYIDNADLSAMKLHKEKKGVIWGKDPKHFQGKTELIKLLANQIHLVSTSTEVVISHSNIDWVGHQSRAQWINLLSKSMFLVGLGNPLSGPSAIDAISVGCMYLNPVFKNPMRDGEFKSQHPFAEKFGLPYTCSFQENNFGQLQECVNLAIRYSKNSTIYIPHLLTIDEHVKRVQKIFDL